MSLLYTLVGPGYIIMSADSRSTVTSFELDGEKYRYQDNYKKLVRAGNFVVAGSGQNIFGGECLETAVHECEGNSLKSFVLNLCFGIQPHIREGAEARFHVAGFCSGVPQLYILTITPDTLKIRDTFADKITETAFFAAGADWATTYVKFASQDPRQDRIAPVPQKAVGQGQGRRHALFPEFCGRQGSDRRAFGGRRDRNVGLGLRKARFRETKDRRPRISCRHVVFSG